MEVRELIDALAQCDTTAEVFVVCKEPDGTARLYDIRDVTADSGQVFIEAEAEEP